jgi:hypothetical protein
MAVVTQTAERVAREVRVQAERTSIRASVIESIAAGYKDMPLGAQQELRQLADAMRQSDATMRASAKLLDGKD